MGKEEESMIKYCLRDVEYKVKELSKQIPKGEYNYLYGIPKNGVIVASMLSRITKIPLTDQFYGRMLVVDDIVDSGKTIEKYSNYDCAVLVAKRSKRNLPKCIKYVQIYTKPTEWVEWFWENTKNDKEDVITRQLEYIGENSSREGLKNTPSRVIRSFDKLYGGYAQNPSNVLKTTFSSCYDEVILLRDIPLFSTCEHHLLPFFGKCHIAYIPGKCGRVVGLSKLVRVMEIFARRMQIQEQLTIQIGKELVRNLKPRGAAVIIQATHMCMTARGVEKSGSSMVTSYMQGSFKKNVSSRQELLNLIKL